MVIEVPKGGYVPVFRLPEGDRGAAAPRRRPGRLVALVALAGVALAGAGWWRAGGPAAPITIAVLPLENLAPEPGRDYFADGLTDEIIRNLSVIEGLTVRSRASSFALKGRPRNVQEAGRLLAVDYLVEGSVLRTEGQLRVHAQLVRVSDGLALWAGKFDRDLKDVFAIQDEISLGIVNNLRLRLGRGRRRYESSVEAYDLFLRARVLTVPTALLEQPVGPANMPGSRFEHSVRSFERALEKDPSFAPAWAGLAATFAMRSVAFPLDHPADELPAMRAAAERACELDPLLPRRTRRSAWPRPGTASGRSPSGASVAPSSSTVTARQRTRTMPTGCSRSSAGTRRPSSTSGRRSSSTRSPRTCASPSRSCSSPPGGTKRRPGSAGRCPSPASA